MPNTVLSVHPKRSIDRPTGPRIYETTSHPVKGRCRVTHYASVPTRRKPGWTLGTQKETSLFRYHREAHVCGAPTIAQSNHTPSTTYVTMKLSTLLFALVMATSPWDTRLAYAAPGLLIANTRGDNAIVQYTLPFADGDVPTTLLGSDAVEGPDHLLVEGDYLYISHGDSPETSAIARMNVADGTLEADFATGGALHRPYGFDFYNGTLYVASFKSDQILMYAQETGDYVGVFAETNGTEEGLCNGPNQIYISDDDGLLYMTTQGSNFNGTDLNFLFNSQIVVYDLATGDGSVFLPPPMPLPGGAGFVSLLGVTVGCGTASTPAAGEACTMYTTDFAGGLRVYAMDPDGPTLLYAVETSYQAGVSTGSLSFDTAESQLYVPVWLNETSGAVVLRFAADDGASAGLLETDDSAIYIETDDGSTDLSRPIGVLFLPEAVDFSTEVPAASPGGSSAATACGSVALGCTAMMTWFAFVTVAVSSGF
jgi:hypothetical protein